MRPDRPGERGAGPDAPAERDGELVGRVLAGDQAAFNELARRHERQALAVAYRLLNNAADTQEVVQDALLRAYRALASLANPDIFGPWLLRIVSNLALNMRRSRARRAAASLDEPAGGPDHEDEAGRDSLAHLLRSPGQRPEEELMTGELQERIRAALDELPDRQRTALVLFSIEGMAQKEVAQIIGCSVEAVKWHVFAARKKLKDKLSDWMG